MKKTNLLSAMFCLVLLGFGMNTAAQDSKSDLFLKAVAAKETAERQTKIAEASKDISLSYEYESNMFTFSLAYDIKETDSMKMAASAIVFSLMAGMMEANGEDYTIIVLLETDLKNAGFLENMVAANSSFTVTIKGPMDYHLQATIDAERIKQFADMPRESRTDYYLTLNCEQVNKSMLPLDVGNTLSVKRLTYKDKDVVISMVVNEEYFEMVSKVPKDNIALFNEFAQQFANRLEYFDGDYIYEFQKGVVRNDSLVLPPNPQTARLKIPSAGLKNAQVRPSGDTDADMSKKEIRSKQYYENYVVRGNDKDYVSLRFGMTLFGWVNDKCNKDIADALFGTNGQTVDEAMKAFLAQYDKQFAPTNELQKKCKESRYFNVVWKGVVCDCYASCLVTTGSEILRGKAKGVKTKESKALLWNLKTNQLLTINDVFTPAVVSEIMALGGENYQVFMGVNGKLYLIFEKAGQQLEAAFSFVDNKEVFTPQFAELAGEQARRVETIFSQSNGKYTYSEKTGELMDVMGVFDRKASAVDSPVASADQDEDTSSEGDGKVFDVVDEMPSFPGGPSALFEFLSKNVKYPAVAEENGVQGRVIVTFVVGRDGSISNVKVVKSVDPSLDQEARRVIRSMPRWIPGKQKGEAVRVKYTIPVTFRLGAPVMNNMNVQLKN